MIPSLHFAFFGASLVSSHRNGAAAYYRGIVRALAARGHRVTFYEPDAHQRQAAMANRDFPDTRQLWAEVMVYPDDDEGAALGCVERAAKRADVLVKANRIGVHDTLLEEAIPRAARTSTTTVFWDVDAAATIERLRRDAADPFRAQVPRYDLVFTCGGGDRVVKGYESFGARACIPIDNALDPEAHFPVPRESRYAAKLALLANRLPDREARIEEFFVRPAAALGDADFLLGGNGWDDKHMPPNVRRLGHVPTAEHNAFNVSPLAVLDVARGSGASGFSPATRVFEAAGAGACIITDAWEGIDSFLTPGREILVAEDGKHVASIVGSLTEDRARIIGENARRRILAEHTYSRRALRVESVLLVKAHKPTPLSRLYA